MNFQFQNFHRSYYEKVHKFLIELSMDDHTHINWNWARWEWMFFHPQFDRNSLDKIGLWFSKEELAGVAIYGMTKQRIMCMLNPCVQFRSIAIKELQSVF
ncbi:MAG: hypothetical protein MR332_07175 [Fusicatenibacter sp.]|nr:hypothetical protein [Fusicatenibacter sp.]